jgi:hypothetical protein
MGVGCHRFFGQRLGQLGKAFPNVRYCHPFLLRFWQRASSWHGLAPFSFVVGLLYRLALNFFLGRERAKNRSCLRRARLINSPLFQEHRPLAACELFPGDGQRLPKPPIGRCYLLFAVNNRLVLLLSVFAERLDVPLMGWLLVRERLRSATFLTRIVLLVALIHRQHSTGITGCQPQLPWEFRNRPLFPLVGQCNASHARRCRDNHSNGWVPIEGRLLPKLLPKTCRGPVFPGEADLKNPEKIHNWRLTEGQRKGQKRLLIRGLMVRVHQGALRKPRETRGFCIFAASVATRAETGGFGWLISA